MKGVPKYQVGAEVSLKPTMDTDMDPACRDLVREPLRARVTQCLGDWYNDGRIFYMVTTYNGYVFRCTEDCLRPYKLPPRKKPDYTPGSWSAIRRSTGWKPPVKN